MNPECAKRWRVREHNEPSLGSNYNKSVLDDLLAWAHKNGYSDIIITSEQYILYRKFRRTWVSSQNPLSESQVADTVRWLSSDGVSLRALSGAYSDFSYTTPINETCKTKIRFRVNVTSVYSRRCESALAIVLRTIAGEPWELARHNLGSQLVESCLSEVGLNLIAGPMGCGKTTLASSLIRHINTNSQRYIVTYEDPIEFDFGLIGESCIPVAQTEIGKGVKSFSQALANISRRSADVIFWGESRDLESIRSLTIACDMGAAVYSTVHANSVASTIGRLVRMFPQGQRDGMQSALISSLQTLILQRLLPAKNGGLIPLRESLMLDDEIKDQLIDLRLDNLNTAILVLQRKQHSDPLTALSRLFNEDLITESVYQRVSYELVKQCRLQDLTR